MIVPRRAAARPLQSAQEFKDGLIAHRVMPEDAVACKTICEIGRWKRPKTVANPSLVAQVPPGTEASRNRDGHAESTLWRQPPLPATQHVCRLRKPMKHHAGKDQIEPLGQIACASIGANDSKARYFPLCLAQHCRCVIKPRELRLRPAHRCLRQHKSSAAADIKNATRRGDGGGRDQRLCHLHLYHGRGVIAACCPVKGVINAWAHHRFRNTRIKIRSQDRYHRSEHEDAILRVIGFQTVGQGLVPVSLLHDGRRFSRDDSACLGHHLRGEGHIAVKDGGDEPPVIDCPECGEPSYVVGVGSCALCEPKFTVETRLRISKSINFSAFTRFRLKAG